MNVRRTRILLWSTAAAFGAASLGIVVVGLQLPYAQPAPPANSQAGGAAASSPDDRPRLEPADFRDHWALDLHRPLYDPPPREPAAPAPPRLRLELLGTIVEPGDARALVRTSDGQVSFKREGDTADGARIEVIQETRIEVTYNDETIALSLDEPQ